MTDRIRQQYAANAAQLRGMLEKAEAVAPRKHRGYTAEQLRERVAFFEKMSTATNEEIAAVWSSRARIFND
jgi:hypothetical protein